MTTGNQVPAVERGSVEPASGSEPAIATPTATPKASTAIKDSLAAILGALILLAFGAFIVYMLANLHLEETAWTRAIFLFGGVEAVAFAAAGYFFGTQVQRAKVEEAQAGAEAATQVARAAGETAIAERRASTVLATGVVEHFGADGQGGLMAEETPQAATLVAQAKALLRE